MTPFPVGTILPFLGVTAPDGWIILDGSSIGGPQSAATRAHADTYQVFKTLWPQTELEMQDSVDASVSRGANADADWNADNKIVLPDLRGRFLLGAGTGPGLQPRTVGVEYGEETHDYTDHPNLP